MAGPCRSGPGRGVRSLPRPGWPAPPGARGERRRSRARRRAAPDPGQGGRDRSGRGGGQRRRDHDVRPAGGARPLPPRRPGPARGARARADGAEPAGRPSAPGPGSQAREDRGDGRRDAHRHRGLREAKRRRSGQDREPVSLARRDVGDPAPRAARPAPGPAGPQPPRRPSGHRHRDRGRRVPGPESGQVRRRAQVSCAPHRRDGRALDLPRRLGEARSGRSRASRPRSRAAATSQSWHEAAGRTRRAAISDG